MKVFERLFIYGIRQTVFETDGIAIYVFIYIFLNLVQYIYYGEIIFWFLQKTTIDRNGKQTDIKPDRVEEDSDAL